VTPDALQDLSRREALRALTARLHAGGVAEAAGDARFLLLGILGLETRDLLIEGGRRLGPAEAASLAEAPGGPARMRLALPRPAAPRAGLAAGASAPTRDYRIT